MILNPTAQTMTGLLSEQLFQSFWMGGFEGACHINRNGVRLDMIASTQHDQNIGHDYAMLREVGITTIRDGFRWHLIDQNGIYDFSSVLPMITAAREKRAQVVWNLCHYGWPDGLDVFSADFIHRFARYAGAIARLVSSESDDVPMYTPINEISFLSWAAGEVGYMFPFAHHRGGELKRQLVRATLAACDAILEVDSRARFVFVDPLVNIVPRRDPPYLDREAALMNNAQYEAWDMIAGRAVPELGGHERYLDIVGANFYHENQWEHMGHRIHWCLKPRDERWVPLHQLLERIHERYKRPLILGETGHVGVGRAEWLREITDEIAIAGSRGILIDGACLYPIIDRHDWENFDHWHNSGLIDLRPNANGKLHRIVNAEMARELCNSQLVSASLRIND